MKQVHVVADAPVSNEDEAGEFEVIYRFFHGRTKCQMIQRISRKRFYRNGNAVIIHKQAHLNDWLMPFFFANAKFSQAFFYDNAFFIQDVFIGLFNLIVEVCHIIIDDIGRTSCFFNHIRVDPTYDPVFILCNKR